MMAKKIDGSKYDHVEEWKWVKGRYVLTRILTLEEAEIEKKARLEKAKRTRELIKRLEAEGKLGAKQYRWISAVRLHEELDRLAERFAGEQSALEVVDAVRWWLMEEQVPGVDE